MKIPVKNSAYIDTQTNVSPDDIPEALFRMKDFIISTVKANLDDIAMDPNMESRTPIGTLEVYGKPKDKINIKVKESSICNLILPCFTFLHWVNFSPGSLKYQNYELKDGIETETEIKTETGNGVIRHVKGSIFRKIFSLSVQILMIIHVVGHSKVKQVGAVGHVKTMFKAILVAYLGFNLAGYHCLFSKLLEISKILNSLQQFEVDFFPKRGKFSNPSKMKTIGWIIVVLFVLFSIAFTSVNILTIGIWLDRGFYSFLEHMATKSVLELNLLFGHSVEFNATESSGWTNFVVALPMIFCAIIYDFSWVFGFLLHLLFGIMFSWIFNVCFKIMCTRKSTPQNTLEDIRKFNDITSVLESFNDVFSFSIITAVLSGSLHFSVYVLTLFTNEQSGLIPIMTAISFSHFWIQLFACAHVHNSAQEMGTELKRRFQKTDMNRDIISNGISIETSQGMQVVFYELLAGKIGFQGGGFFTITYSFIGTVMSMIATYSLVVMQFKESS